MLIRNWGWQQQLVWCATARASSVFPVPGGPYSSTPCRIWRFIRLSNGIHLACWAGDSSPKLPNKSCSQRDHMPWVSGMINSWCFIALGWEMPKDSKISGCLMGSSMTSLISWSHQIDSFIGNHRSDSTIQLEKCCCIANDFVRLRFPWAFWLILFALTFH